MTVGLSWAFSLLHLIFFGGGAHDSTSISWVDPKRNIWRSGNHIVWKTDGCITQIYTDQGIVGIGEGCPYEGPDNIKKATEEIIRPLMIGKNPFDVEFLTKETGMLLDEMKPLENLVKMAKSEAKDHK